VSFFSYICNLDGTELMHHGFLDLSGEMVEIPNSLAAGPPPTNTEFFFADI
jgi:hypothetical protein